MSLLASARYRALRSARFMSAALAMSAIAGGMAPWESLRCEAISRAAALGHDKKLMLAVERHRGHSLGSEGSLVQVPDAILTLSRMSTSIFSRTRSTAEYVGKNDSRASGTFLAATNSLAGTRPGELH